MKIIAGVFVSLIIIYLIFSVVDLVIKVRKKRHHAAVATLTEEKVDSGDPDDPAADNQNKEDVLNV